MCSPRTPAEQSVPLPILYEKYCNYLTESNLIKVRGLLVEPATNSYVLAERDIYLENPEIKIRVRAGGAGVGAGQGPRASPELGVGRPDACTPEPLSSLTPRRSSNSSCIEEKHHEARRMWDSHSF